MSKQFAKDALGWGIGLWLFGYILGFVFFAIVPKELIGWFITPIATAATLWVLFKKVHPAKSLIEQGATKSQFNGVKGDTFGYFLKLAVVWVLIAVVFDYLFIVKALAPTDGYYKPDVYLYYILAFLLPLLAGWLKTKKQSPAA